VIRRQLAVFPDSIVPASAFGLRGAAVVAALMPSSNDGETRETQRYPTRTPVPRVQRPDRCAEIPANLKAGAAQKFTAKLLDGGLVEEIRAEANMPAWRKGDDGPFALRLTDAGTLYDLGG
jgi:hypothetical protein